MNSLKSAFAAATVFALSSAPASAQIFWWWPWGGNGGGSTSPTTPARVPEIDGSTALLAVAAIAAALAFAWERNRRRA
ncbi:VPEID-CTERM sorting domain-containing protein [Gemmobacter sp.]|uniref:VPEID-CTERM sorting domain-containing protein n=1 Tax=Gemmobacter sp. TaxID=1898957 RepID=UPI002B00232F|nr:VPEID-CTERM sorting domain-containing protein [Gemmobacter sp.]